MCRSFTLKQIGITSVEFPTSHDFMTFLMRTLGKGLPIICTFMIYYFIRIPLTVVKFKAVFGIEISEK